MKATDTPSRVDADSGIALAELAYVLPLMTFIICATIDTGRMLNQYLDMTQVVQEGVRLASGLPDLEAATFSSLGSPSISHQRVQSRVQRLIELEELPLTVNEISSTRVAAPSGGGVTADDNTVTVRVTATYHSIFPVYDGLTMSISGSGPYLYRD